MTALGTLVEGRPGKVIAAIGTLFAAAYAASLILLPKPDGRIVIGDAALLGAAADRGLGGVRR